MYVLNITDDSDNITLPNCTDNENSIDKTIPTLLLTIPCGLSFLCSTGLMLYTILKLLITKKDNGEISIPKSSC